MDIVIVGSTGTLGKALTKRLEEEGHEVVGVSRHSDPAVNIDRPETIDRFFASAEPVDAVICVAGNASFGSLESLNDKQFEVGIRSKLMGQVNLVRKGIAQLPGKVTFVLTSGMLSTQPWPGTSPVAMVNAGLEGFVRAAALDLEEHSIAVVSPPLVKETALMMGRDPEPWPEAGQVAEAYLRALSGNHNGEVLYVDGYEPG